MTLNDDKDDDDDDEDDEDISLWHLFLAYVIPS